MPTQAQTLEPIPPRTSFGRESRWKTFFTPEKVFAFVSPVMLLVIWQVLAQFPTDKPILDQRIFSTPTRVAGLSWTLLTTPQECKVAGLTLSSSELGCDSIITLWRLFLGMLFGALPGMLLGLTMGLFRWPRAVINPLVSAIYPLPRVALFPLVLLIVGLNETSNVIMVALAPFFTMLIGTLAGVLNVDPIYLKVAKSFKVKTLDLYTKVVFPAALPIILSAFRLSLGLALLGVIAVEFLMTNNGLGHMIWHSWQILSLGHSMVGLVITGLFGYAMFIGLDYWEKRVLPWATT